LFEAEVSAGNDEVDYAKYVEFGTRRSRAQPFLRPALARAREELFSKVKAAIESAGR
jgi:HK97 gp10 family phage protein